MSEANGQSFKVSQSPSRMKESALTADPKGCEFEFAKELSKNEGDPALRLAYAITLYRLGRYWGALSHLEKLRDQEKAKLDPDVYLYLGHCYVKTRKTGDAVKAYESYVELNPNAENADKYRTLISVLGEQAQKQGKPDDTTTGDYLKETTQTGLFRWPDSRIPISVFIEPAAGMTGYRPEFDDALRHAFQEWTATTGGKVKFDIRSEKAGSAIVVSWTDDLHAPELTAEAGKAWVVQDLEGIKSAEIKLLTVSPFNEGPVGCEMLYNICLHEIGHALGLMGHSPYPEDIMYPQLSTQAGISPRDIRTFSALYEAAHESQAVASSGRTSRTDDPEFERLSPKLQADLLVKEGTKDCFAGKYQDSMKKLEMALKIDPNNEFAKSNLAVAANNLAVAASTDEERLRLLRLALFWNPASDAGRNNLESQLQFQNLNTADPQQRVKLADELEKKGDVVGAYVELSESRRLKQDPSVDARMEKLRKKLQTN